MKNTPVFKNKFEQKRFTNHVLNDRYDRILVIWGKDCLFNLLKWYQHVEYYPGILKIIDCIEKYQEAEEKPQRRFNIRMN
ncbi:hypothetical protein [Rubrolithibacter danxiaensis]|uniref:hypothetical protein n=1 Tax=Rubrolithibacter danxiaensis TaxID=3390805 RepID=UPI003BF860F2